MQAAPQQIAVQRPTGFLAFDRTATVLPKLIELETEINNDIARLEQQRILTGSQGNGGSMNHPADLSYREPIDDVTLERDRARLKVIARAKVKLLVERSYGVCDNCAGEIPEERLTAWPEAICCCDCQKKPETRRRYH